MKLFNHLHLQIHNVPVACFPRRKCKTPVRRVTLHPVLLRKQIPVYITQETDFYSFKLLDLNIYHKNKNTNTPASYYVLGTVSGAHSILTARSYHVTKPAVTCPKPPNQQTVRLQT